MPGHFAAVAVGSGKTDRRYSSKFEQTLDQAGRGVFVGTRKVEEKRRRTIEVSERTARSDGGRDARKFQEEGQTAKTAQSIIGG